MKDYFPDWEFHCCVPACEKVAMSERFLARLNVARSYSSFAFKLNSAFRTPEWECSHGRSGSSAHCLGRAVDISCKTSIARFHIIRALLKAGFTRIGVSKTFIHVDDLEFGEGKAVNQVWLYD